MVDVPELYYLKNKMCKLTEFLVKNALGHLMQGMIDEGLTLDILLQCNDNELLLFTKKAVDKIKLRIAIDNMRGLTDGSAEQPVITPIRETTTIYVNNLSPLPHEEELLWTPKASTTTLEPALLESNNDFTIASNSQKSNESIQEWNDQELQILDTFDFASLGKQSGKSLRNLLESVTFGRVLLEKVNKEEKLNSRDRTFIVKLIVESELRVLHDITNTIRKNIWQHWANEVASLFKGEAAEIYYIPYHVVGGKIIQASGMLHNRLITHRRLLTTSSIKRKSSTDSSVSSENSKRIRPLPETFTPLPDQNSNAKGCLDWLRGSSTPYDLVASKWLITLELRNKILSEGLSYMKYFASYPALTLANGHKLLSLDFKTIYPNADKVFDERFPIIKNRLLNLITEKGGSARVDQTTLDLLDLATIGEEQASLAAFLAITVLLRGMPTISIPRKKVWKLSREEVRTSFIGRVATVSDIERYCVDRESLVAAKGIPEQPYILAVGSSWANVTHYEIVVHKGQRYQFSNICSAVRKAYHIYWAIDSAYPKDSAVCWMFVQRALFNMKSIYDTEGVPLRELLNQINY